MNGTIGERCEKCTLFAQKLEALTGIPTKLWDERCTTVSAHNFLNETNTRGKKRKAVIDAVAAGKANGGYDNVFEAAEKLGKVMDVSYQPNPENAAVYDRLFAEYRILHDYFGRGDNDVMKRLKAIKKAVEK